MCLLLLSASETRDKTSEGLMGALTYERAESGERSMQGKDATTVSHRGGFPAIHKCKERKKKKR